MRYIKLFEVLKNRKLYPVGTKVILIDSYGIEHKGEFILYNEYEIEEVNPKPDTPVAHYKLKGIDRLTMAFRYISTLEYEMSKYNL